MRTINASPVVAAAIALAITACGGGGGGSGTGPIVTPTVASVAVSATASSLAVGATTQLSFVAKDAGGTAIPGLAATWSSQNSDIARVNATGAVVAQSVGATLLSAQVGSVTGTTLITVTPGTFPAAATVSTSSGNVFVPGEVDIAKMGSVTWQFFGVTHNVTFTSGVTGTPANIPNSSNATTGLTFLVAGKYDYRCTIHAGMTGTVYVH